MMIRQEELRDQEEVYNLIKKAFETAAEKDGTEQDLVEALRNSEAFIPELSLVAVENDRIIGHILFSKVRIGNQEELALAPLSVHPKYQRKGIGLALIEKGHHVAKELGYEYVVVLGHETYYPKAGYVPASQFGIRVPFDVPDQNFMAIRLCDGAKKVDGIVQYDKAFGI